MLPILGVRGMYLGEKTSRGNPSTTDWRRGNDILGCARLCTVATLTRVVVCLLVSQRTLYVHSSRQGICVHSGCGCGTRLPTPGQLIMYSMTETPEDTSCSYPGRRPGRRSILRSRTARTHAGQLDDHGGDCYRMWDRNMAQVMKLGTLSG